jgi:hypothetical protein
MAILFEIEHVTNYKYANTVTFDTHRAMFLPRPAAQGLSPCGLDWSPHTPPRRPIQLVGLRRSLVSLQACSEPNR